MSCSRNQIIKRYCTISILIRFSRFVQDINYDWMYHLLCLVLLICEIIIPPSSTLVTFQIDAVLQCILVYLFSFYALVNCNNSAIRRMTFTLKMNLIEIECINHSFLRNSFYACFLLSFFFWFFLIQFNYILVTLSQDIKVL